ncbi:hypothetical protein OESDEN_10348 [Oesophagostomum dentatum]|uniref:ET module n=1 Tax=Oesophagostomum dentatum TaxID=61180 RepID=A0A0B1SWY5_OESDE|nr:hypothetical protein OESDEN_10348 [Oesophagostomum dentatum]
MAFLRYGVLLLAILTVAFAIKCYTDTVKNNEKPNTTHDCKSTSYCIKKTDTTNKDTIHQFYCDDLKICSKNTCTTNGKVTTCCCSNKDLCNGSSKFSAFFILLSIVLARAFF